MHACCFVNEVASLACVSTCAAQLQSHLFPDSHPQSLLLVRTPPAGLTQEVLEAGDGVPGTPLLHGLGCPVPG